MIRVFCIDDHLLILQGLRYHFKNSHEIDVIGWNNHFDTAISDIETTKPDIILLDLFIEKHDPVDNIRLLKNAFPLLPVIILTCEESYFWKSRMMKEGASAYISKTSESSILKEIILSVVQGSKVFPPGLNEEHRILFDCNSVPDLDDKDFEIIMHLSRGVNPKEIAGISEKCYSSINYRINRLLNLYEAKTPAELVRIFFK